MAKADASVVAVSLLVAASHDSALATSDVLAEAAH
jgi:hypothetical protein